MRTLLAALGLILLAVPLCAAPTAPREADRDSAGDRAELDRRRPRPRPIVIIGKGNAGAEEGHGHAVLFDRFGRAHFVEARHVGVFIGSGHYSYSPPVAFVIAPPVQVIQPVQVVQPVPVQVQAFDPVPQVQAPVQLQAAPAPIQSVPIPLPPPAPVVSLAPTVAILPTVAVVPSCYGTVGYAAPFGVVQRFGFRFGGY